MLFESIDLYILKPKEERQKHLHLDEECIEIGGDSRKYAGLLCHYLNVTFPIGMKIHLCHACNNPGCSNPRHLYWGTAKENMDDSKVRELGNIAQKKRFGECK